MRTHVAAALRSGALCGWNVREGRKAIVVLFLFPAQAGFCQLSLSWTASDHHGYNVSCFGYKDGAIDLTVTGGTPPYTYTWSHGPTMQDVSGLPAGYYVVQVKDAAQLGARAEITLTEPLALGARLNPYVYGNDYNISCFNCYNGSITSEVQGGVAPYEYDWADGAATANRSNLGSDNYVLTVADANGCVFRTDAVYLRQPERSDWTMNGNAGTDPATQYIGTSDSKDLVFKTNGAERLRLKSDGVLKAPSLAFDHGYRLVMVDSTGQLKLLTDHNANDAPLATTCYDHGSNLPWTFCGNIVFPTAKLGTKNNVPLRLISNDVTRLTLYTNGKVGIGTTPPPGPIDQYRLFVEDGIATRDVRVKVGVWPDYVFDPAYQLLPLDDLRAYLNTNRHLPGVPSASEVKEKEGVEVGDLQAKLLKVIEEQALYILELKDAQQVLEQRVRALEASSK